MRRIKKYSLLFILIAVLVSCKKTQVRAVKIQVIVKLATIVMGVDM